MRWGTWLTTATISSWRAGAIATISAPSAPTADATAAIVVCAENRPAILSALDAVIGRLAEMREIVSTDARDELFARLQRARDARTNLPIHATHPQELAEVRIPIPDRTGAAAEVFTLAAQLGVNIASFEVVHLAESNVGVAVVLVAAEVADLYRGGLIARGFRPAVQRLQ